jgi:hypothetical protein
VGNNPLTVVRSLARRARQPYDSLRDRRVHFRDLSQISPRRRRPASPLVQFYSSNHNIGNYTPVLGSQQMLGMRPDTWCVHHRPIDFDFINQHYTGIIIGGAGLLDPVFAPFWREFHRHARLPTIIWGVGGCWPPDRQITDQDREIVAAVADRCDLVNVRDDLTAEYYGLRSATVAPCPTIVWLRQFRSRARGGSLLVADHHHLVPAEHLAAIRTCVLRHVAEPLSTRNIQEPRFGLMDILRKRYFPASRVVTTRLHGAIIAYGLGIPFIALSWDDKIRAFHTEWGGGQLVEMDDLPEALSQPSGPHARLPEADDRILEFGSRARAWVNSITNIPSGLSAT